MRLSTKLTILSIVLTIIITLGGIIYEFAALTTRINYVDEKVENNTLKLRLILQKMLRKSE